MTFDEHQCFYYGTTAAMEEKPFNPEQDERMNCMVSSVYKEKVNQRNLSAWQLGYLTQYANLDHLVSSEMFHLGLRGILPQAKEGAAEGWADFARECVEAKQYVDSTPEPDETAQIRWYDTLLAGFVLLKQDFGEEVATAICDLSLTNQCLYPYEMERAGLELKEGGDADDILQLMEEGKLESSPPVFPKLRDIAPQLVPEQGPEMTSQL